MEEHSHPTSQRPLIARSDEIFVIFKSPNASIDAQLKFPNASRIGFRLCFNTSARTPDDTAAVPEHPVSEKSTDGAISVTFILIVAVGGGVCGVHGGHTALLPVPEAETRERATRARATQAECRRFS